MASAAQSNLHFSTVRDGSFPVSKYLYPPSSYRHFWPPSDIFLNVRTANGVGEQLDAVKGTDVEVDPVAVGLTVNAVEPTEGVAKQLPKALSLRQ